MGFISLHAQQRGKASFYSRRATGARTSSGERLRHNDFTCAHRTHPFGTKLRVKNLNNGKEVVVRVNDRGPFGRGGIVDFWGGAAQEELKQHHIEIDSAKKHLQDLQERHEELNNRCSEKQHQLGTLTEQYQTILETLRVKIALSQPGTEDIRPDTKYIQRNTEDSQRHTEYVQQQAETTALTIIDFPAEGTPYKEWTADNKTIPVFLHERYQNGNELLTQILCSIRYWWQFKALFVPSAAWVYTLAKIFGNTAVYTLHIEYNWLHFSDFCRNGLQEALNEAYTHPEKNYMLILEGLNCTQPECGLRPLLNVIAGIEPVISTAIKNARKS